MECSRMQIGQESATGGRLHRTETGSKARSHSAGQDPPRVVAPLMIDDTSVKESNVSSV